MLLSIFALFAAFALGGLGALALHARAVPRLRILLGSAVLVTGYWFAVLAMPFHGVVTEFPLVLLLAAAVSGPLAIFFGSAQGGLSPDHPPRVPRAAIVAALVLPVVAASLFAIVSRVNQAIWLGWACDGPITEVSRDASNHGALVVVVAGPRGPERFWPVDEALWDEAKVGQRLTKEAGSPMAILEGRRIRMVPRQMGWLNEPG